MSSILENFNMGSILKRIFKGRRITLAVVGIPASGKSYLLSDIVNSLANLGFPPKPLESNGVAYNTFSQFQPSINNNGVVSQTEVYALRPKERMYGAKVKHNSDKTLEIVFADIPGETFSSEKKVSGKKNIDVYLDYTKNLKNCGMQFYVTEWKNVAGQKEYVVEPISDDKTMKELSDIKSSDETFDDSALSDFNRNRQNSFQDFSNIIKWLKTHGYKAVGETKKVSGKTILKDFFKYQPDTLMYSLGKKIAQICPELGVLKNDFDLQFKEHFYFLHYCSVATDIVLCDKLLVPKGTSDSATNFVSYPSLVNGLDDFIKTSTKRPHLYLAFRGVDFIIKNKETAYSKICKTLKANGLNNDAIRNIMYSLFSYTLWNHIDSKNTIENNKFDNYICGSVGKGILSLDKDHLQELLLDTSYSNAVTPGQSSNVNTDAAFVSFVSSHIGDGIGDGVFLKLLNSSYEFVPGMHLPPNMENMPPHVYFTCTPITLSFDVYVNDPAHGNKRFKHDAMAGPKIYFDTAGSHFCFGSYQLCLDILSQNGINVIDTSSIGELLHQSQGNY